MCYLRAAVTLLQKPSPLSAASQGWPLGAEAMKAGGWLQVSEGK